MDDEYDHVIIDIGSGTLKAGFASDDAPKYNIPMIIGKPKSKGILVGMDQKDCYIGHEAKAKQQLLIMEEPVKKGVIENYDSIKDILKHLFDNEFRISAEDHKMLMTEPPNNPKKNREKIVEVMFEDFKVPHFYLGNQAVLSLFATGRTTGTVLDSGQGITHTVPIYEGYAIPYATTEIPISGNDLTKYLIQLLKQNHPGSFDDSMLDLWEEAEKYKKTMCKVALDFEAELKAQAQNDHNSEETVYNMPGQQAIVVKEERLKCPELLFTPSLMNNNIDIDGIHKYTSDSIMKCDIDIKRDLFKNIVLAGGCTMFEGMQARMRKEIQALAPSTNGPDVASPADRKYSCWLGGAILSMIEKFEPMYITRREYEEDGK